MRADSGRCIMSAGNRNEQKRLARLTNQVCERISSLMTNSRNRSKHRKVPFEERPTLLLPLPGGKPLAGEPLGQRQREE